MQKIRARTLYGINVLYFENENLFSIKLVIQFLDNVKEGLQMHKDNLLFGIKKDMISTNHSIHGKVCLM